MLGLYPFEHILERRPTSLRRILGPGIHRDQRLAHHLSMDTVIRDPGSRMTPFILLDLRKRLPSQERDESAGQFVVLAKTLQRRQTSDGGRPLALPQFFRKASQFADF